VRNPKQGSAGAPHGPLERRRRRRLAGHLSRRLHTTSAFLRPVRACRVAGLAASPHTGQQCCWPSAPRTHRGARLPRRSLRSPRARAGPPPPRLRSGPMRPARLSARRARRPGQLPRGARRGRRRRAGRVGVAGGGARAARGLGGRRGRGARATGAAAAGSAALGAGLLGGCGRAAAAAAGGSRRAGRRAGARPLRQPARVRRGPCLPGPSGTQPHPLRSLCSQPALWSCLEEPAQELPHWVVCAVAASSMQGRHASLAVYPDRRQGQATAGGGSQAASKCAAVSPLRGAH
jgi:hypothetical protein